MRKRVVLTIGAVAAGYALLLTALFWRVWLRGQMSGWDCVVEYWPDLVSQIHALRHGEWPMWNPYALGGYPMLADPQAGLFSPVNWLLWLGSVPFGDGAWLIQAKVLLGLWAALGGMHAWTWRRTGSHAAAVVAALVTSWAAAAGPQNSALLWPMLYLPWGLLALERFVAHPSARRGTAVSGAVADGHRRAPAELLLRAGGVLPLRRVPGAGVAVAVAAGGVGDGAAMGPG
ncbi:MAG: hypothetical protein H6709_07390 [Kofleriaceae bacterium]|nr:hypothetical protein [Kofleriaceae bacterium]